MGFPFSGYLTNARSDFWWSGSKLNRLGAVSHSRAGVALTYDFRLQRMSQELAKMRAARKDYAGILDPLRKSTYEEAIRDFESHSDSMEKRGL